MAFVNVDLYVVDSTPRANPVSGVVIRVLSQDGKIFFTQVTTDVNGHAGFLLPDNTTYQIRQYKFNVSFTNPQYIVVNPAPAVNSFSLTAVLVSPPVSLDPRL